MVVKMLLPLLGGVPAVWNTCLVFFQSALLIGYGYAYAAAARLEGRRLVIVHVLHLLARLPRGAALGRDWRRPAPSRGLRRWPVRAARRGRLQLHRHPRPSRPEEREAGTDPSQWVV